jgi:hypothetical protein
VIAVRTLVTKFPMPVNSPAAAPAVKSLMMSAILSYPISTVQVSTKQNDEEPFHKRPAIFSYIGIHLM